MDQDLFARFISGFYKATNGQEAAVHYFEKTDLIKTLVDSLQLENKHCQTLIGQVLIEYSIYMEEKTSIDNLLLQEIENKINKSDKMDEIVKFTILIKLQGFKTKLEKEDLSILEQCIGYLSEGYKDGEINGDFIDLDIPGVPQIDISWVRCCHYLIKLIKDHQDSSQVKFLIQKSNW